MKYSLNEYGLRQKDMDYMHNLFKTCPEIERVILYGSRAAGIHELGSDVDLALIGKNISFSTLCHIHEMLEEQSPTLLWFDVLHYDSLKNEKLKSEIDCYGKIIYVGVTQLKI